MWSGVSISSSVASFRLAPRRLASCRSLPDKLQFSRSAPANTDILRSPADLLGNKYPNCPGRIISKHVSML